MDMFDAILAQYHAMHTVYAAYTLFNGESVQNIHEYHVAKQENDLLPKFLGIHFYFIHLYCGHNCCQVG